MPQNELASWSAGASLGAIPYENTGLNHLYCTPNKLWEYPNAGVPILCTALEEMQSLVEENGIGYLLPRDFLDQDIVDVVNGIDPSDLAEKRRNCLSFIEKNNWDSYAPRLIQLYHNLAPLASDPDDVVFGGANKIVSASYVT